MGQWALFTRFGVMCWCHIILSWRLINLRLDAWHHAAHIGGFGAMAHSHIPMSRILDRPVYQTTTWVANYGSLSSYRFLFWDYFWILIALFGVRRGFEMILSQRAPSSLNMSSYRAIWTHFRQNFILVQRKNTRYWSQYLGFFCPKMPIFVRKPCPEG